VAEVTIRAETTSDIAAIRAVTSAAFEGTPYSDGSEAEIVDALRATSDLTLSLVAALESSIVGHVALSPVAIGDTDEGWFGLGPISVLPEFQRSGFGTRLMRAAMDWLEENGAAGCVLVGDPGYYGRFGFISDGSVTYGEVPIRYVQKKVVTGPDASGEVRYSSAFGGH